MGPWPGIVLDLSGFIFFMGLEALLSLLGSKQCGPRGDGARREAVLEKFHL